APWPYPGFPPAVAVGMPIPPSCQHPPHSPVLAHLTHGSYLGCAGVDWMRWRRNEHWGTGEARRLQGVGLRAARRSAPMSTDSAGCGGEADATTGGGQSSGTLQVAARYREWLGTESIRPPADRSHFAVSAKRHQKCAHE